MLRCNRCDRPICTACAVLTPTGYRCKECVRGQQKIFDTAQWIDYPLAFVVAGVLSFFGSLIASYLGFFTIFIAPVAGVVVAEAVRWVVRRRRSRLLYQIAAGGAIAGALPILLMGLLPALFWRRSPRSIFTFVARSLSFSGHQHHVLPLKWNPNPLAWYGHLRMLTDLRIENFAIIQQLELEFKPGLITFTGETGAGKSIILDAITAVVGGRADITMIRAGSDRASVEATFRLSKANHEAITDILEREDLLDDPDYVTLSRELRREGRSTAQSQRAQSNLNLVRDIGAYLIDIHGQSEHLSLLNVRQHIHLLDRYAASEAALADYRKTYDQLMSLRRELNQLRQTEQDAERRTDLLSYQLQEIDAADLKPGEETELRQERDRLANAENLASLAQQTLTLLDEGIARNALDF